MTDGIGLEEIPAGEGPPGGEQEPRRRLVAELDRLWARGREVLGCDFAVMGGAMTWVSERSLVSAISNAGGFGVIASGSMSPDLLAVEICATKMLTRRPFGVPRAPLRFGGGRFPEGAEDAQSFMSPF